MSAPLPPDEIARLETLVRYDAPDAPPDDALDRLTALAARLFRVPSALVCFVGAERQWFKSRHGLALCESGLGHSFCAHAILPESGSAMVVPDAALDPRFADNPLVTGPPGIRFYAGVPLRVGDGAAVGTFCLIDTRPRAFSDEDRATLLDLAAAAANTLELHASRQLACQEAAERRAVETSLRRMAANTPGMIYQIILEADGTFRFAFVGEGCRELYGVEPQALYERPEIIFDVLNEANRAAFREGVLNSARTLEPWLACGPYRAPDGSVRWLEGRSRPEALADGRTIWHGMITDVTARMTAERAAARAARRVHAALESIGDAFFCLDRDWRFIYVNDHAARLVQRRREDLLGRCLWEEFPHAEHTRFGRAYHRAVETGKAEFLEDYSHVLQTWVEVHAYPSEEGLSISFRDIADRKEAQRQLDDNHKLLSAIIEGSEDCIYIKDRDGRYLLINPAGAAMLRAPVEEIVGHDDQPFFPLASVHQNRASDLEVMRENTPRTYESRDRIADAEHFFLTTKIPYRDAAGNLLGIIAVAREVTAQRRAAEALREAKEEAEKANLAKSEFLSRISHELRTPLNAILGFGQLLEISDLGERPSEGVAHILKAGRHLLGLIDEVLAISRIEAGRMNLSLEPVAVGDIVSECMTLVSRLAADRRVTCEYRYTTHDPGQRAHVMADRQRLRQVLLNLLSNAVKYNREGGRVTLSCRGTAPDATGQRWLRLEVADTGTGLTAGELGRLFTPFERLGAERTGTEGTGLGLALSKGLVEAMQGRIGAESVPGVGSTFWVELPPAPDPLEAAAAASRAGAEWHAGAGDAGTVLYVEDNLSNLRLVEMVFEARPGLQLLSAQQGMLGLEIARARLPDLILLDLHLPDLPGWEVLQMLQDDPATRAIPVVVISADATPGRIERLRAAGASEYLTKPIDVPALLAVLHQHIGPATLPVEKLTRAAAGTDAGRC